MLKFWVPQKINGKSKLSFVRSLTTVIRMGLDHEITIYNQADNDWYLETDIVFKKEFESRKVPGYLKLLKNFLQELNAL